MDGCVECCICQQTKRNMLLYLQPCSSLGEHRRHVICVVCVETLLKQHGGSISCPICRACVTHLSAVEMPMQASEFHRYFLECQNETGFGSLSENIFAPGYYPTILFKSAKLNREVWLVNLLTASSISSMRPMSHSAVVIPEYWIVSSVVIYVEDKTIHIANISGSIMSSLAFILTSDMSRDFFIMIDIATPRLRQWSCLFHYEGQPAAEIYHKFCEIVRCQSYAHLISCVLLFPDMKAFIDGL